jgi:Cu2+-exporting ATPase
MSGSSAIVAINALMLKRTRLTGIKSPSTRPPDAGIVSATAQAN